VSHVRLFYLLLAFQLFFMQGDPDEWLLPVAIQAQTERKQSVNPPKLRQRGMR
jgi:hypothetical protein